MNKSKYIRSSIQKVPIIEYLVMATVLLRQFIIAAVSFERIDLFGQLSWTQLQDTAYTVSCDHPDHIYHKSGHSIFQQ